MSAITHVCALLVILNALFCTNGEQVAMKIVEEPSNYGWNNMWNQQAEQPPTENVLKMRISPANFTGPKHFRKLLGLCFTLQDSSYKYDLCPFFNVTQHEQTLRWNPYRGILGVYQQWEIINNTFVAMVFEEGDGCGNNQRTTKVHFLCGDENKLTNVSEPNTCRYQMHFKTPYVCPRHSMLVYPTLSAELRNTWDHLEGELYREEITQQGYKKKLGKIFEKAEFYLSGSKKKELAKKAKETEKARENAAKGEFETLAKCSEEYKLLKKEIEGLRTLLALGGGNSGNQSQNIITGHGKTVTTAKSNNTVNIEIEAQNITKLGETNAVHRSIEAQNITDIKRNILQDTAKGQMPQRDAGDQNIHIPEKREEHNRTNL